MGLGTEEAVVEVEEMEEEEGAEAGDEFELLSAEAAEEGSPGADDNFFTKKKPRTIVNLFKLKFNTHTWLQRESQGSFNEGLLLHQRLLRELERLCQLF